MPFGSFGFKYSDNTSLRLRSSNQVVNIMVNSFVQQNDWSVLFKESYEENLDLKISGNWILKKALIPKDPIEFLNLSINMKKILNIYFEKCISEP